MKIPLLNLILIQITISLISNKCAKLLNENKNVKIVRFAMMIQRKDLKFITAAITVLMT